MPLQMPEGKRFAVNIGPDLDTHDGWIGMGHTTPGVLSRGEFGAEVGLPRLLRALAKHDIRGTFCTPAHTMMTFPRAFRSVVEAGHEVAAHGLWHEPILELGAAEERRLLEKQIAHHLAHVGVRPRGYRSPSWDFSNDTLALLEEFDFEWDSSLMGRDFHPYRPRAVTVNREEGDTFGPPSPILEIPVSWYLDDFPFFEFVAGALPGVLSNQVGLQRWKDYFDYGYANEPNGVLSLTVHPECIGRPPNLLMFEEFLDYVAGHTDVWFATLSEICDAWSDGDISDRHDD